MEQPYVRDHELNLSDDANANERFLWDKGERYYYNSIDDLSGEVSNNLQYLFDRKAQVDFEEDDRRTCPSSSYSSSEVPQVCDSFGSTDSCRSSWSIETCYRCTMESNTWKQKCITTQRRPGTYKASSELRSDDSSYSMCSMETLDIDSYEDESECRLIVSDFPESADSNGYYCRNLHCETCYNRKSSEWLQPKDNRVHSTKRMNISPSAVSDSSSNESVNFQDDYYSSMSSSSFASSCTSTYSWTESDSSVFCFKPQTENNCKRICNGNTGLHDHMHSNTGLDGHTHSNTGLNDHLRSNTGLYDNMQSNTDLENHMNSKTGLDDHMHSNTGLCDYMHSNTDLDDHMRSKTGLDDHMHSNAGLDDCMHNNTGLDDRMHSNTGLDDHMHSNTDLDDYIQPNISHMHSDTDLDDCIQANISQEYDDKGDLMLACTVRNTSVTEMQNQCTQEYSYDFIDIMEEVQIERDRQVSVFVESVIASAVTTIQERRAHKSNPCIKSLSENMLDSDGFTYVPGEPLDFQDNQNSNNWLNVGKSRVVSGFEGIVESAVTWFSRASQRKDAPTFASFESTDEVTESPSVSSSIAMLSDSVEYKSVVDDSDNNNASVIVDSGTRDSVVKEMQAVFKSVDYIVTEASNYIKMFCTKEQISKIMKDKSSEMKVSLTLSDMVDEHISSVVFKDGNIPDELTMKEVKLISAYLDAITKSARSCIQLLNLGYSKSTNKEEKKIISSETIVGFKKKVTTVTKNGCTPENNSLKTNKDIERELMCEYIESYIQAIVNMVKKLLPNNYCNQKFPWLFEPSDQDERCDKNCNNKGFGLVKMPTMEEVHSISSYVEKVEELVTGYIAKLFPKEYHAAVSTQETSQIASDFSVNRKGGTKDLKQENNKLSGVTKRKPVPLKESKFQTQQQIQEEHIQQQKQKQDRRESELQKLQEKVQLQRQEYMKKQEQISEPSQAPIPKNLKQHQDRTWKHNQKQHLTPKSEHNQNKKLVEQSIQSKKEQSKLQDNSKEHQKYEHDQRQYEVETLNQHEIESQPQKLQQNKREQQTHIKSLHNEKEHQKLQHKQRQHEAGKHQLSQSKQQTKKSPQELQTLQHNQSKHQAEKYQPSKMKQNAQKLQRKEVKQQKAKENHIEEAIKTSQHDEMEQHTLQEMPENQLICLQDTLQNDKPQKIQHQQRKKQKAGIQQQQNKKQQQVEEKEKHPQLQKQKPETNFQELSEQQNEARPPWKKHQRKKKAVQMKSLTENDVIKKPANENEKIPNSSVSHSGDGKTVQQIYTGNSHGHLRKNDTSSVMKNEKETEFKKCTTQKHQVHKEQQQAEMKKCLQQQMQKQEPNAQQLQKQKGNQDQPPQCKLHRNKKKVKQMKQSSKNNNATIKKCSNGSDKIDGDGKIMQQFSCDVSQDHVQTDDISCEMLTKLLEQLVIDESKCATVSKFDNHIQNVKQSCSTMVVVNAEHCTENNVMSAKTNCDNVKVKKTATECDQNKHTTIPNVGNTQKTKQSDSTVVVNDKEHFIESMAMKTNSNIRKGKKSAKNDRNKHKTTPKVKNCTQKLKQSDCTMTADVKEHCTENMSTNSDLRKVEKITEYDLNKHTDKLRYIKALQLSQSMQELLLDEEGSPTACEQTGYFPLGTEFGFSDYQGVKVNTPVSDGQILQPIESLSTCSRDLICFDEVISSEVEGKLINQNNCLIFNDEGTPEDELQMQTDSLMFFDQSDENQGQDDLLHKNNCQLLIQEEFIEQQNFDKDNCLALSYKPDDVQKQSDVFNNVLKMKDTRTEVNQDGKITLESSCASINDDPVPETCLTSTLPQANMHKRFGNGKHIPSANFPAESNNLLLEDRNELLCQNPTLLCSNKDCSSKMEYKILHAFSGTSVASLDAETKSFGFPFLYKDVQSIKQSTQSTSQVNEFTEENCGDTNVCFIETSDPNSSKTEVEDARTLNADINVCESGDLFHEANCKDTKLDKIFSGSDLLNLEDILHPVLSPNIINDDPNKGQEVATHNSGTETCESNFSFLGFNNQGTTMQSNWSNAICFGTEDAFNPKNDFTFPNASDVSYYSLLGETDNPQNDSIEAIESYAEALSIADNNNEEQFIFQEPHIPTCTRFSDDESSRMFHEFKHADNKNMKEAEEGTVQHVVNVNRQTVSNAVATDQTIEKFIGETNAAACAVRCEDINKSECYNDQSCKDQGDTAQTEMTNPIMSLSSSSGVSDSIWRDPDTYAFSKFDHKKDCSLFMNADVNHVSTTLDCRQDTFEHDLIDFGDDQSIIGPIVQGADSKHDTSAQVEETRVITLEHGLMIKGSVVQGNELEYASQSSLKSAKIAHEVDCFDSQKRTPKTNVLMQTPQSGTKQSDVMNIANVQLGKSLLCDTPEKQSLFDTEGFACKKVVCEEPVRFDNQGNVPSSFQNKIKDKISFTDNKCEGGQSITGNDDNDERQGAINCMFNKLSSMQFPLEGEPFMLKNETGNFTEKEITKCSRNIEHEEKYNNIQVSPDISNFDQNNETAEEQLNSLMGEQSNFHALNNLSKQVSDCLINLDSQYQYDDDEVSNGITICNEKSIGSFSQENSINFQEEEVSKQNTGSRDGLDVIQNVTGMIEEMSKVITSGNRLDGTIKEYASQESLQTGVYLNGHHSVTYPPPVTSMYNDAMANEFRVGQKLSISNCSVDVQDENHEQIDDVCKTSVDYINNDEEQENKVTAQPSNLNKATNVATVNTIKSASQESVQRAVSINGHRRVVQYDSNTCVCNDLNGAAPEFPVAQNLSFSSCPEDEEGENHGQIDAVNYTLMYADSVNGAEEEEHKLSTQGSNLNKVTIANNESNTTKPCKSVCELQERDFNNMDKETARTTEVLQRLYGERSKSAQSINSSRKTNDTSRNQPSINRNIQQKTDSSSGRKIRSSKSQQTKKKTDPMFVLTKRQNFSYAQLAAKKRSQKCPETTKNEENMDLIDLSSNHQISEKSEQDAATSAKENTTAQRNSNQEEKSGDSPLKNRPFSSTTPYKELKFAVEATESDKRGEKNLKQIVNDDFKKKGLNRTNFACNMNSEGTANPEATKEYVKRISSKSCERASKVSNGNFLIPERGSARSSERNATSSTAQRKQIQEGKTGDVTNRAYSVATPCREPEEKLYCCRLDNKQRPMTRSCSKSLERQSPRKVDEKITDDTLVNGKVSNGLNRRSRRISSSLNREVISASSCDRRVRKVQQNETFGKTQKNETRESKSVRRCDKTLEKDLKNDSFKTKDTKTDNAEFRCQNKESCGVIGEKMDRKVNRISQIPTKNGVRRALDKSNDIKQSNAAVPTERNVKASDTKTSKTLSVEVKQINTKTVVIKENGINRMVGPELQKTLKFVNNNANNTDIGYKHGHYGKVHKKFNF